MSTSLVRPDVASPRFVLTDGWRENHYAAHYACRCLVIRPPGGQGSLARSNIEDGFVTGRNGCVTRVYCARPTDRHEPGFVELASRTCFPKSLPSMAFLPGPPRPLLPEVRATGLYATSGRTRHVAGAHCFATRSTPAVPTVLHIPTFLYP